MPARLEEHDGAACRHHNTCKRKAGRHGRSSSRPFVGPHHCLPAMRVFGLYDGLATIDDSLTTWPVDDSLIAIDDCLHPVGSLFDLLVALVETDASRRSSCRHVEGTGRVAGGWNCRLTGCERIRTVSHRKAAVSDVEDLAVVGLRGRSCC